MSGATRTDAARTPGAPVPEDAADRDVRTLRRVRPMRRSTPPGMIRDALVGCALDVETTGLDHARDRVVELALQSFWADASGRILATGRRRSWRDDPGAPLPPEIVRVTGLRDADLRGRAILEPEAACLIADADFVVAHNAAFDRPFVEARLPFAAKRPWVCTLRDVGWPEHGFEGRRLGDLLMQMGWFFEAHRAQTDVDALLHLLDHPLGDGGTVLRAAVARAALPTWRVEAVDAPFAAKDRLRLRGYRWNAESRFWSREVADAALGDEVGWAAAEIYSGRGRPRATRVTWRERYAA